MTQSDAAASCTGTTTELCEVSTSEELAEALSVAVDSIHFRRRHGHGPVARYMGKHVRFLRADILAWKSSPESGHLPAPYLAAYEGDSVLSEFSDIEDVAAFLRIPVQTLRHWRKRGEGPAAHLLGRHLRYFRSEVLEWMYSLPAANGSR
jgi:predicted DNA-binding transcriptional regulator AlpA